MNEKLKVACIGAGNSGTSHLIMLEKFAPGCAVAFCDYSRDLFDSIVNGYLSNRQVSEHFKTDVTSLREDFRDLPFYTDVDEMFAKEDINTVVISTYCSSHAELALKCAKYGVNILLEKPIATTEESLDKLWETLRDYPRVVTVNFTMRGAPVTVAAKKHVQNGDIGNIVSVQYINHVHYGTNYFRKWFRTREKSGGLLLQKAVHDFDIINNIIGLKPVKISAFGSRLAYGGDMPNDLTCDACEKKRNCYMSIYVQQFEAGKPLPPSGRKDSRRCVFAKEIDINDNEVVIIQYEGGVTATYSQTFSTPVDVGRRGGLFIGDRGVMQLSYYGEFKETPNREILVGNSQIDISKVNSKPGTEIKEVYDWGGHGHFDGTEYGLLGKLDLLRGGSSDVAGTLEEGYISTKMCLAAQKSIETGQVISLDLDIG